MTVTETGRDAKRPQSLTGHERTARGLVERFLAEELWRRPRYAWHRFWGDMNPLPRTMRQVWDFAAGDADYAAHMVNGSPDEATLQRTGAKMAERLINALAITPEHCVLDLGPGVARVGRELAPHVRRWVGADVSRKMLDRAAERMQHLPNATFAQISGDGDLPFPDEVFDRAYAHLVFFHIDKQEMWESLRAIARCLKPGGILYGDTWNLQNEDGWQRWLAEVEHYRGRRRPVHHNRWSTEAEMRTFAERAGLVTLACLHDSCWLQLIAARPFADGSLPALGDLSILPPPTGSWYYND
jgi:SAM-dependent methyltransferase